MNATKALFAVLFLSIGINAHGNELVEPEKADAASAPVSAPALMPAAESKADTNWIDVSPVHSSINTRAGMSFHKDFYAMPFTWSPDYENSYSEFIYQLSTKVRVSDSNFYFAYTQKSFWQVYNSKDSNPFRETNYNPEFFYRKTPGSKNWLNKIGADFGVEHESNGQPKPASRGWNRSYAAIFYPTPNTLTYLKVWHVFGEASDSSKILADNPDIIDYYGHAELHFRWQSSGAVRKGAHLMLRGNVHESKGAAQFDYTYPTGSKDMHWYFSVWKGYGESLIDYDKNITRTGLGVVFKR
ncbi:MAG: phospholipase A [Gammaproteobacteria bacterium]|nr:phospholipase A [Gammaproteobacteria bacterium]